jgi:hypothetical protein
MTRRVHVGAAVGAEREGGDVRRIAPRDGEVHADANRRIARIHHATVAERQRDIVKPGG